jgi:hypothetical protein
MTNKVVKLAVIRDNKERQCPFGLPVTDACYNVGKLVNNMVSMSEMDDEDEINVTRKSNNRIFMFSRESDDNKSEKGKNICKYANHIFKDGKVECSNGHYGEGVGNFTVNPGPLLNTYLGVGYNSQYYTVPFNTDFEGINRYYFASEKNLEIEKTADDDNDEE